ncbi:MAG: class I tRNA ligase family protein [Patescibacteria group bacterium]
MKLEEEILKFWQEKGIFKKTLTERASGKKFVFYDGPPFATGLPHYGHILAGTIKDVIPRYQTMRGRFVRREWGWDCHGLPLENIIEEELGLKHKKDIEKFGIENFNDAASRAVLRYENDWKKIIPKTGRFVDMENPYKTMDATYTESVWWSFKTLYDKGLIYEGHKIMLVCPRCETTLAQSEVALGGYHDVTDISVIVKFELIDEPGTFLLAWTTTPWTLPGNTALAVNKNVEYVKVSIKNYQNVPDGIYIFSKKDYEDYKKEIDNEKNREIKTKVDILKTFKGSELVGKSYIPPFDYFYKDEKIKNHKNGWKVYHADFVTTETGTGIAHEAPAFGEDDMQLALKNNIPIVQHVGMDGKMKNEVKDFRGLYVKQKGDTQSTDIEIVKYLAQKELLFAKEKVVHPYPLCWRCDTPLLNYATNSWFVKVTDFKDKLIRENKKIVWVPAHMRDGRFGKWLEAAKDWAISRTRFWGAPLPVWRCEKCKKIEIIGSLGELQKSIPKSGNKYFVMRHGQAESNISGTNDSTGNPNNHLTENGRESIRRFAKEFSKKGITRIMTSPFARAKESAEVIAHELGLPEQNILSDQRLIEFNHGSDRQGKKISNNNPEPFNENDLYIRHDDGESHAEVRSRVVSVIFDMEKTYKNETILIVTHGSPMWMLITGALGMSDKETIKYQEERKKDNGDYFISNGQIEKIDFVPFPHNKEYELDFHRPYIDEVKLSCTCGGEMERIKDVFDCWFESGSMPYGQFHYPFENKKVFKENFPADFIAEGLDQTRGWFYSMMVLGVALFGETPFKNVIVNGLILGEDGQKMAKKLKNYPDVTELIEKYGADALRYYFLSLPVMRGEDIAFSEKGISDVYKKIILRLLNVYSFYKMYAHELRFEDSFKKSKNVLDQWILSRLSELSIEMTRGMDAYELDVAVRGIEKFVDDFSTWYLRRSRERVKGDDKEDKEMSLSTIRFVLFEFSKLIAPAMPFVAEDIYQKVKGLKDKESVHLEAWPEAGKIDKKNIAKMETTRCLVELALALRAEKGIKVRQPLAILEVSKEEGEFFEELIRDEVNVKKIFVGAFSKGAVTLDTNITPELKEEGQFRDLTRAIQELRKKEKLTHHDVVSFVIDTDTRGRELISKFEVQLKKAVSADKIVFEKNNGEEILINDTILKVSLKNPIRSSEKL